MSKPSILQQIRRIKSTTKPVSRKARQQQQQKAMQRTLTQAYFQRQKAISQKSLSKNSLEIVSDQQQQRAVEKNYSYDKKTFYFPIRDIDLSHKRVQLFQKLIKKRQGQCLNQQQAFQSEVLYVVSTHKISKFILNQKLQRTRDGIRQKIKYNKILNYQYIIDCEKYGTVLDIQPYQLFKCSQQKTWNKQLEFGQPHKIVHIEQATDDEAEVQEKAKGSMSSTVSINRLSKTQSICIMKSEIGTVKKNQQNSYKSNIKQKYTVNKDSFACQKGSTQSQFSVNQFIYEELMKFYSIYENEKDTGRKIAYLKAASAIKSYHKEIESERDIMQLKGIGKKIVNKVKQLLETGQIQKLSRLQQNKQTLICQQLTRVWGIGVSKAKQLQQKGITSLEILKQRQDLLNKNQRIGLKYVDQFQQRIPRDKVTKMFEFIRGRFYELVGSDNMHNIQVCGSYRRGKETCGDMDVIISRKDGTFQEHIIVDFVAKLQKQGFLTDHLSIPSKKSNDENKSISYMGVCVFKSQVHHRIDIKYYSIQEFAFATLYFTGSDMFNRSMRLFARKKGFSLSDHGLTVVERTTGNQKVWKGQNINLYSERQIFEYLGLDYKSPMERNI